MFYKDYKIELGENNDGEKFEISMENIFLNTLVLGNKGTGKSEIVFNNLAYQTILDKNVGATFIVSSKVFIYFSIATSFISL